MEELFLILAVVTFLFGLVSSRFDKSIITPPMMFTAAGVLITLFYRSAIEEEIATKTLELVAELTLVIVLFIDASRINLPVLIREHKIPIRLLGIGLPLTVLVGAVIAKLIFGDFSIAEAGLLAAILAPTDAALGQAVVSSPKVPIRIRLSLNVESGLNDGVILPLVMLFAALATVNLESGENANWLNYWLMQVTLGPLVGIVIGFGGGYLLAWSKQMGNLNANFLRLSGVALAVIAWAGANEIGGNGFIAAFVGGMCISCFAERIGEPLRDFGEAEGQLIGLATFLLFGMVAVLPAFESAGPATFIYAVLSLTLIRMLPTAVALLGLKLHWQSLVFIGWFGPRGLASLLFALLVVREFEIPNGELILSVSIITVVLSMILHGITAIPGTSWYAASLATDATSESLENKDCESHPHHSKFSSGG